MRLGRSSTPRGNSTGSSEKTSRSAGADAARAQRPDGRGSRVLLAEFANQVQAQLSSCGCGLNSHTAMIGNSFAKIMYSMTMAAKVAAVIATSTHVGV